MNGPPDTAQTIADMGQVWVPVALFRRIQALLHPLALSGARCEAADILVAMAACEQPPGPGSPLYLSLVPDAYPVPDDLTTV